MICKLEYKTITIRHELSNKRRQVKKSWQTDELTTLWNVSYDAERGWSKAVGVERLDAMLI